MLLQKNMVSYLLEINNIRITAHFSSLIIFNKLTTCSVLSICTEFTSICNEKRFSSSWRLSANLMLKTKWRCCSSSSCRIAYFHWVVAYCFKKRVCLQGNKKNKSINPLPFKYPRKGTETLMFLYIHTEINNFPSYLHHIIIYCFIY